MRFYLPLYFFLFIFSPVNAQTHIQGILTGDDGHSPSAVSILLHDCNQKDHIISYCFSDENGQFKLSYNSSKDTIALSTHSLNYRDTTIVLLNKNQLLEIELVTQVNKIKEVSVRGLPIIAKDDTTTYMVSSFEKNSDESIGDVIQRMPGFTVDAKGKIAYMGRPIDKYYIEGMDLLEGRYNIANKNLSNKAVGAVEVLHNHQPVKMLRQQQFHDGTSVNIKLKNKYTTTFRGTASGGFPLLRHSINVTPMLFSPKHQMIASVQSNNIGDDLSVQHRPMVFSFSEMDNLTNRKPELLSISSIAPTTINNQQRYLLNHSNLLSFNYLTKLSDDEELKTNVSYYNDWIDEEAAVETQFYLEKDTIRLNEKTRNGFGKNSLITDFIYNQNASKQYINNKFRFENYWDKARAVINQDEQQQKAYTPHFSLADELDWHRMVGKHFVSFKAFMDYNHSPQKMCYRPGVFEGYINEQEPYKEAIQHFKQDELKGKVKAAFTLNKKNWAFSTQLGASFDYNELQTSIENEGIIIDTDSLRNKIEWNKAELSIDERISYKSSKLKLRVNLPLSMVHYTINDYYHTASQEINQPLFSPRLYANYEFCYYWTSIGTVSYRRSLGEVNKLTQGYIIRNYRNLNRSTNYLPEKEHLTLTTKLEYKNPIAGWLGTVKYSYSQQKSDLLFRQVNLGNGIFQNEAILLDNERKTDNVSGELTYFISPWQTTLGLTSNYNIKQSQYMLNGTLSKSKYYFSNLNFSLNMGYWRKCQFKYIYGFNMMKHKTSQATSHYYEQTHTADLFIYPNKKQWLNIRCEYNNALNAGESLKTFFGDVSYAYKPMKGKFTYKLQLRNIFDSRTITQYSTSEISLIKNTYHLRPREILVNVSYRF